MQAWAAAWPSQAISESRRRLVELRKTLDELPPTTSSEIESALARFLVIRTCGHLEFTFEETLCRAAEDQASPKVAAFVRGQYFRGSNPKPGRLVAELAKFDVQHSARLGAFLAANDEELQRELEFLVDRRNKIAHGQNEGLGRRKAIDLADIGIVIGDWIVAELAPSVF